MIKKSIIFSLMAVVGALPAVAMADVNVRATVDKTKDIKIVEKITIVKDIDIKADIKVKADKAAESQALTNQTNDNNRVCTNCDEKKDTIVNSGNDNKGVLSINQAAGNMNNQGNAVSIAVDVLVDDSCPLCNGTTRDPGGFANSQAHVDQKNRFNDVDTVNVLFRDAKIENSINRNTGVAHVNQGTGNMANQANSLSLAVSLTQGGVALAEADLGQVNTGNRVRESDSSGIRGPGFVGIKKQADIVTSVNFNTGVIGVNQSAGNMANQANVVSFASTTPAQ
jgi:hypothetical protein